MIDKTENVIVRAEPGYFFTVFLDRSFHALRFAATINLRAWLLYRTELEVCPFFKALRIAASTILAEIAVLKNLPIRCQDF